MARVHRTDFAGPARGIVKTPQGGVRVEAAVTRTGVLRYRDDTGREWGEYRPPEEVFAPASLATLRAAPVTDLHPTKLVRADSWSELAKGHADGEPRRDGHLVVTDLVVQAAPLVALVESGDRREVSSGYECDVDPTPGVSPEGERYDAVQRAIRYNHIALGPVGWGRAGAEVSLRMDGAAVEVPRVGTGEHAVKRTIKIKGREYRLDGDTPDEEKKMLDEAQAAVEEVEKADSPDMDAKLEGLQSALTSALTELATLRAELAAQKAMKPEVTEEDVPEQVLDAALSKRLAFRADAAKVLGADFDFTGKSVADVRAAVVAKVLPALRLDGLGADVVEGMYRACVAGAVARTDGLAKLGPATGTGQTASTEAGPETLARRTEDAWKTHTPAAKA